MKQVSMIGLDLAKNVFAVHGIDAAGNVVIRRSFRRAQLEKFFSKLPPTVVGMEACGGAHHWGRRLGGMGLEIRMMLLQQRRGPAHLARRIRIVAAEIRM